MNVKVACILALADKAGRCVIRMDKASGFTQVTITKRKEGYALGTVPGSRIVYATQTDVVALLTENRIFIEKWYA